MAVLLEGEALALSSRTSTGKSVVYVKLTDSALKSLEESVRQKVILLNLLVEKGGLSENLRLKGSPTNFAALDT